MSYYSYAVLEFKDKATWEKVRDAAEDMVDEIGIISSPDKILEGNEIVVCEYNWVNHFPDEYTLRDFMGTILVPEEDYGGERWGEERGDFEEYGRHPIDYIIDWSVSL